MTKDERYIDIRETIDRFRIAENKLKMLNEGVTEDEEWNSGYKNGVDSVPYMQQDEVMSSSIQIAKQQFGADFSKFKNPMLYYPDDGDIVLSGEISSLNNAKFQFRYKDPTNEGCFVWTEPIQLTESNLTILKKVYGVFKNWKSELDTTEDKKPMNMKNQDDGQPQTSKLTPGDDY